MTDILYFIDVSMYYNNLHYIFTWNEWNIFPILHWTRYLITANIINTIIRNEGDNVNPEKKKINI